jgi:type II secretory pathway pseudopilin PulG
MRKPNRGQRGFTLLETLIVVGLIMVVTGIAVVQTFSSMQSYRANAAMDVVMSQLRVARQLGISQRRAVLIQFNNAVNPPTVGYQVQARPLVAGDVNGPWVIKPLPVQMQFVEEAGVPDTPMSFGTCGGAPVCIGGGCVPGSMYFTSTGAFSSDENGVFPCNGTIFIGTPNQPGTARAVTIMGGTGRVRPYTFIGPLNGAPLQVWTE